MHNLFILTCIHKQPQVGTHIIIWPFNRGWLNALVLPLVEEFGFRLTCDSALACGTKDQLMKKTLKKKKYVLTNANVFAKNDWWFKMSVGPAEMLCLIRTLKIGKLAGVRQGSIRVCRFTPEVSQYCASIPQNDDSIDRYILPRTTVFHQFRLFLMRGNYSGQSKLLKILS